MAARVDLDRCPTRLLHHVPGACSRETRLLPSLSLLPLPPPPPSLSSAADNTAAAAGLGGDGVVRAEEESGGIEELACGGRVAGCSSSGIVGDRLEVNVPGGNSSGRVGGGRRRTEVEVENRAGACGLWLRLVIMPLMKECLAGSYRCKLLALHMTQVCMCVRRCGGACKAVL